MKGYDYEQSADVFAVGFQEIIDLNASNIVKARYMSVFWGDSFMCLFVLNA